MKKKENLLKVNTGDRFGKLTVIIELDSVLAKSNKNVRWVLCRCDCGKEKPIQLGALCRSKDSTKSCGCISLGKPHKRLVDFKRKKDSPLYVVWNSIKARCFGQVNFQPYKNYGGRGISVCDEWRNDFEVFRDWCLSHGYKKGLQIDRINNDGDYKPDNCRFVTPKENANNTRGNRKVVIGGITKNITQWAETIGISVPALRKRINSGFPDNMIISKRLKYGIYSKKNKINHV